MSHVNDSVVLELEKAIQAGDFNLAVIPKLLRKVLVDELWREFAIPTGETVRWDQFRDFVVAPRMHGLGAELDMLERIVAADKELAGMLWQATHQAQHGGDRTKPIEPEEQALYYKACSWGTRADYGVVVLKENEPEQYAAVIAGERSVNAALVATGRRKPYVSVRVDDPASAARTLRKKLTVEQRHELARLLVEEH